MRPGRITAIDVARGVALVAMTIYHFTWDLDFFGWILQGTISQPGWVGFARAIATTFIALAGVSLVLAHGRGIRWRGFMVRLFQVSLAALALSIVSYVQTTGPTVTEYLKGAFEASSTLGMFGHWLAFWNFPTPGPGFIFFGILHAIALFSLLALPFARLPWWISVIVAAVVFAIGWTGFFDLVTEPALLWLGLSPDVPNSNDYVPLFPWFAALLAGIALGKIAQATGLFARMEAWHLPRPIERPLAFIGRHSLIYYLVHQPLMFGALWLLTTYVAQPDPTPNFLAICERECGNNSDERFCKAYCGCVADGFKAEGIFVPFTKGEVDVPMSVPAQTTIHSCRDEHRAPPVEGPLRPAPEPAPAPEG
ncbi:DUF1624 domain-containing protein [Rhizobiaceae bacterium]|nr:DUF1624 domain-containing protein [Rhizobiaceae bacterium]